MREVCLFSDGEASNNGRLEVEVQAPFSWGALIQ